MSEFQIIPFDDDAGPEIWTAFHAFRRAMAAELHPDEPVTTDEEREHQAQRTNPLWESRRWLALDGEEVVGSAGVDFRRPDSRNAEDYAPFLGGGGSVVAHARRKGVGTLLLRRIHSFMHVLDKSVLTLSAETEAGHAFLTHIGAVAKHSMLENRIRLAGLDWPQLRAWESAADAAGVAFECYAGRVPRDVLVSLLPTFTALSADVPHGSLESPPVRYEIEGYDQWYENLERTEGAHHLVLLREPGGDAIAVSEALWGDDNPTSAFQTFTAVARPWRGRGLACAVKSAILRQIRAAHPGIEEMRTFNAESNAAMLSVNKRLGFRVHRRHVTYQITRAELDARL